jgi:hypothetical protein
VSLSYFWFQYYPKTLTLSSSTTEWDQQSSFDTFFTSFQFANFKTSVLPYVSAPAIPELFESPGTSMAATSTAYAQVFRLVPLDGPDAKQHIEQWWRHFTAVLVSVQKHKSGIQPSCHHGHGLKNVQGMFVGIFGWQSVEV